MRNLSEITSEEWAELIVFINTTVYGKTKYPHPDGLVSYNEEVIASLRHIKDGIAEKLRPSKLAPVLSEEFMPFFVVKWLKERGFLNELKERQCTIPSISTCTDLEWSLYKQVVTLKEDKKKLEFMIENGLGWEDMKNDITMPHEL